jgi:hypothetical protein
MGGRWLPEAGGGAPAACPELKHRVPFGRGYPG